MKLTTSGTLNPIWLGNSKATYPELDRDMVIDACVIGGGITGLTTAYLLRQAGFSVAVIEDGYIGSGETGRTTAHISNALDDRYSEIERLHGSEKARLAAESHTAAINEIQRIVAAENIDCDFKRIDGYLFVPPGDSIEILEKELISANRAGLTEVKWVEKCPVDTLTAVPCLSFSQQAQFHPLKYIMQLAACIVNHGGQVFENTHAAIIEEKNPAVIHSSKGYKIYAAFVVVATNAPIIDHEVLFSKMEPSRTYVIGANVTKDSIPHALFWDTMDPYHYVRLQPEMGGQDILIIGGEDHRTGITHSFEETFKRLETWAYTRFPQILSIDYCWSGQVLEPVDYLAFIGFSASKSHNILLATGYSGNGMTHGTIAGMLIRDLILKRQNPWEALYNPQRNVLKNLKDLASNNIAGSIGYTKYLTSGEVATVAEIKKGEGAIIREGLTKVAVYRNEQGELQQFSAICPHMKAILEWNSIEKTWDCPAHGSRFSACGEVINGPANDCLEKYESRE